MSFFRNLYFTKRFFLTGMGIILLFTSAYLFPVVYGIVLLVLVIFTLLVISDIILLFSMRSPHVDRQTAERWSNGDDNLVSLEIRNRTERRIKIVVLDEIPEQFEARNFRIDLQLEKAGTSKFEYNLRPIDRGEYFFGKLNLFLISGFQLVERRIVYPLDKKVEVFPSFHNFETGFITAAPSSFYGGAPLRKLGHSMEFEQISDYVSGDDVRNLNWKATARKGSLMVNNYTDEKSQQVFCIIDKGRLMKMPFNGLTLLDHAINSSLRLVQTCLKKSDKVGLITFNTKISSLVAPDKRLVQRDKIMQALFKEETDFRESDFEMLYMQIRKHIKGRSLLILFTNFETLEGLSRQLPYLKSISRFHLVLVVFFENTEVLEFASVDVNNVDDVFRKAIAGQYVHEKRLIAKELNRHGILTILSSPQQLTINVLNKYLELKARQAL